MDYLFIVAVGRSGSTLLQGVTNCLERTHIKGENGIAVPLASGFAELLAGYDFVTKGDLRGIKRFLPTGKSAARGLVSPKDIGHPWFGLSEVNIEALEKQLFEIISESLLNQSKCTIDVNLIGFKEIRWHYHRSVFKGMNHLFPNAKYIFNYRNSSDIVKSGWWKRMNVDKSFIDEAQAWMSSEAKSLGIRAIEVNYEDYVSNPSMLTNLETFCQRTIDWDKARIVLRKQLKH